MKKYHISEFPLKVKPCKYWWVRYANACTYISEQVNELMWKVIKKLYPKAVALISKPKTLKVDDITDTNLKYLILPYKRFTVGDETVVRIPYVIVKDGDETQEIEITNPLLLEIIKTSNQVRWCDCPYLADQSKCPFYEEDEWYSKYSLYDLRNSWVWKVDDDMVGELFEWLG